MAHDWLFVMAVNVWRTKILALYANRIPTRKSYERFPQSLQPRYAVYTLCQLYTQMSP